MHPQQESLAIANIQAIVGEGRCVAPFHAEANSGKEQSLADFIAVHTAGKQETRQVLGALIQAEMPWSIAANDQNKILIPFAAAHNPAIGKENMSWLGDG